MSSTNLPSSFDKDNEYYEENGWQKFSRRLKEEPLIPLGCGLTVWALLNATKSIRAGDHNRTNRMFRARLYAQGFTLVAMIAGSMYWKSDRQKRKEFDDVVKERKAKEKNELWIKELEARDEEERAIRAERERKMRRLAPEKAGRAEQSKATESAKHPVLEELAGQRKDSEGGSATSIVDEKEGIPRSTLESLKEVFMGKK